MQARPREHTRVQASPSSGPRSGSGGSPGMSTRTAMSGGGGSTDTSGGPTAGAPRPGGGGAGRRRRNGNDIPGPMCPLWLEGPAFTLATYNVLADAYILPERYTEIPPADLEPALRHCRLLDRLVRLDADILCLQEVEAAVFESIARHLPDHQGQLARKRARQPDGCATFVRRGLPVVETAIYSYGDGTGHVAQITSLELDGGAARLGVANTHLRWD